MKNIGNIDWKDGKFEWGQIENRKWIDQKPNLIRDIKKLGFLITIFDSGSAAPPLPKNGPEMSYQNVFVTCY